MNKNEATITLRQQAAICGVGGETVILTINTKEKPTEMKIDSTQIEKLFSDHVLDSRVSYITTEEGMLKINVVVKE